MSREYTNKLIELIEEGILTHKQIFDELMCWHSEDEVKDFCCNGFASEIEYLFKDLKGDD